MFFYSLRYCCILLFFYTKHLNVFYRQMNSLDIVIKINKILVWYKCVRLCNIHVFIFNNYSVIIYFKTSGIWITTINVYLDYILISSGEILHIVNTVIMNDTLIIQSYMSHSTITYTSNTNTSDRSLMVDQLSYSHSSQCSTTGITNAMICVILSVG